MAENFGTVTFEGEVITLTEMAYQTNSMMSNYSQELRWEGDGPSYMTEYKASGVKADGSPVIVTWHFKIAREGETVEGAYPWDTLEEDYDWDKVESVEPNRYADF